MELTRKQVIEILEKADSTVYKEPKTKTAQALEYAIASLETDEAYQPKNDLGFDCISRADAIQAMQDTAKKLTNEDTINGLRGAVAILFDLPSVTQETKGHWIDTNEKGFVYHRIYKCSHCGATVCEYPENMRESKYKYCSNCGSRNEVEE